MVHFTHIYSNSIVVTAARVRIVSFCFHLYFCQRLQFSYFTFVNLKQKIWIHKYICVDSYLFGHGRSTNRTKILFTPGDRILY